jgi:hypothetical protein
MKDQHWSNVEKVVTGDLCIGLPKLCTRPEDDRNALGEQHKAQVRVNHLYI